jgi:type II secretory pathway pseudopilin PulG
LIELLIVVAIVGLSLGIVLGAIQNVRESAMLLRSENNLRQIGIAQSSYMSVADRLPPLAEGNVITRTSHGIVQPKPRFLFHELLPYLEQQQLYNLLNDSSRVDSIAIGYLRSVRVTTFLNPLDRSSHFQPVYSPITSGFIDISSYAANAMVFEGGLASLAKVSDGLSNTIFFSEHYGWRCGSAEFHFTHMFEMKRPDGTVDPRSGSAIKMTRPTFADRETGDFYPDSIRNPPVAYARAGVTFQTRPRVEDCDPRQANASSSRGLQVLLGDGSVRILRPSIGSSIFWAAVTPSGGEVEPLN